MDQLKLYFFEFDEQQQRENALRPLAVGTSYTAFRAADRSLFVSSALDVLALIEHIDAARKFRLMLLRASHYPSTRISSTAQALAYVRALSGEALAYEWHQKHLEELSAVETESLRSACLQVLRNLSRSRQGKEQVLRLVTSVAGDQTAASGVAVAKRPRRDKQGGDIRINGHLPSPEEEENFKLKRKLA